MSERPAQISQINCMSSKSWGGGDYLVLVKFFWNSLKLVNEIYVVYQLYVYCLLVTCVMSSRLYKCGLHGLISSNMHYIWYSVAALFVCYKIYSDMQVRNILCNLNVQVYGKSYRSVLNLNTKSWCLSAEHWSRYEELCVILHAGLLIAKFQVKVHVCELVKLWFTNNFCIWILRSHNDLCSCSVCSFTSYACKYACTCRCENALIVCER